jgi:purine-binding chemotaxis protein CheW
VFNNYVSPNIAAASPAVLSQSSSITLLIFHLSGQIGAFLIDDVERIAPMAELTRPPGLPSVIEGILNLCGAAVPVLRMDRLMQLPSMRLGLYSMLVILGVSDARVALLVDRVSEIVAVPGEKVLPISPENSFNGCSQAAVMVEDRLIPLLSPAQLLLTRERAALAEFQAVTQERLIRWESCQP